MSDPNANLEAAQADPDADPDPAGDRPLRAVVLVGNPAAPYSRGLRIARALAGAGYRVEIAATAGNGLPEREQDGPIAIRRYVASGPYRSMAPGRGMPAAQRERLRVIEARRRLPLGSGVTRRALAPRELPGVTVVVARTTVR